MLIEIVARSQGNRNYFSIYEFNIDDIICIERELRDVNRSIEDYNISYYSLYLKNGLKINDIKKEEYDRIIILRKSFLRNKRIDSIIE